MSRAAVTVAKLAREAGRERDEVLLMLWEAGVAVSTPEQRIPRSKLALARRTLDLGRPARQRRSSAPVGIAEDRASDAGAVAGSDGSPMPRIQRPTPPRWPRHKLEGVRYLTTEDVMAIHVALREEFHGTADAVEPPGVKDQGALEGAVHRAQTARRLYSTVLLAGAALVHSLNCNHAFWNGNKRTSLLALAIFLEERNDRYLMGREDDLFELIVGVASHTLVRKDRSPGRAFDPYYADRELLEVHRRLRGMVTVPTRSDKNLKWHELVRRLERFDCEVSGVTSNQAKIRRRLRGGRVLTAVAGARNPGAEILARQVRQYRKQLELTDEFGVDSSIFYDGRDPHPDLPHLIRRYRGVLERLSLHDRTAPEQERSDS